MTIREFLPDTEPFEGFHKIVFIFDRNASVAIVNEILEFVSIDGEPSLEYDNDLCCMVWMTYDTICNFEMMGYEKYLTMEADYGEDYEEE